MNRTLDDLLRYKNVDVCERYNKMYPHHKLSAEQALIEVMKYLWLSEKHQQDKLVDANNEELNFVCSMYPEMFEIDDMWHTFLIFTKDYTEFCLEYFGKYMHHIPKTKEEEFKFENFEQEFSRYLSYVYDNLGEETVRKWFAVILNESA